MEGSKSDRAVQRGPEAADMGVGRVKVSKQKVQCKRRDGKNCKLIALYNHRWNTF